MTVRTALLQGQKLLDDAKVHAPRLTAEVLLSHSLKRDRTFLYTHPEQELTEVAWIHYGRYLHERIKGKPTQYITKTQEFYGRDFRVTPAVLIPRPETELVVEHALTRIREGDVMVDVGSGSGAIGITIALERRVLAFATDISVGAIAVANANASRLGARVNFIAADLLSPFRDASVDAVVSNPPYVSTGEADGLQHEVLRFEPHVALFSGPTGNEMYQRIVTDAQRVLRPGGILVFELGWKSLNAVQSMLAAGWTDVQTADDLAGIPRILSAKWSPPS